MAYFKVVYNLHQGWEEWMVEVPDDIASTINDDNEFEIIRENAEFVALTDTGNSAMEVAEVTAVEQ